MKSKDLGKELIMELTKVKLSDVSHFVEDKISSSDVRLEDYIITDNLLQNKQGRVCASNLPPKPCSLIRFQKGDVLVANIRPYLKKIWQATSSGGASNDVLVIRANDETLSEYIYSLLLQDDFYTYVMKAPKGSKMPRGDHEHIMRHPILDIPHKKEIGRLVAALDDKIALNKKMNQKLERIAKRLYDYWFVQHDFPDKNGRPYKTSGGPMTYNPTLKREIPVGWTDGVLSDIANITMGQSPDGSSYNEDGEGMIFYQGSTDFGMRFPTVRQYTTAPTRFAKKGDILMSVRAPVGAVNIANTDCCIGRGLSALNSKLGSLSHLYFLVDVFKKTFENKNTVGTTFGSITKDELYALPVVIPDKSVIEQFEKMAEPIFERQMKLGEESNRLIKLRDKLLPLLMNGQVEVE